MLSYQEVDVPDPSLSPNEKLYVETLGNRPVTFSPEGLEYAAFLPELEQGVTVEMLRAAVDRYSARRTTVTGSYAHRHYIETGHALKLGCCLGTET